MKATIKNIRNIERTHYVMQLSGYFTELSDRPGIRFAYTDIFSDVWYNQAYDIIGPQSEFTQLIHDTEDYFKSKDRIPCFYTSPATDMDFIKQLTDNGYVEFEQESWMLFDTSSSDKPSNSKFSFSVVQGNFNDFSKVYRQGLPGPEVELYITAAINGHRFAPGNLKVEYLLAYHENTPVGMLGLVLLPPVAGVYAIATIPEWQAKGVATLLNNSASNIARSHHCTHLVLQTVTGEDSEMKFEKMGYYTLFKRSGYAPADIVKEMTHG